MTLNELASKEVIFRTNKTVVATKALISMVEHKPIRDFLKKSVGLPVDKIAEFVGAYLLGHQLIDAYGYDTQRGTKKVEIKWSFLNRTPSKNGNATAKLIIYQLDLYILWGSCRLNSELYIIFKDKHMELNKCQESPFCLLVRERTTGPEGRVTVYEHKLTGEVILVPEPEVKLSEVDRLRSEVEALAATWGA
jgi:hypothetical protein